MDTCLEHANTFAAINTFLISIITSTVLFVEDALFVSLDNLMTLLKWYLNGEYGNRNKTSTNRDNLGYYKRDTDEIKEMTEEYLNFVYQVCAADDKDKPPEDFQLFDVGEIYRSIHF